MTSADRLEEERRFWREASSDPCLRDQWICDRNIADRPCVEAIATILEDGIDVVELGCGIGRLTAPLAHRFPSARFHAFDLTAEMLAHAPPRANVVYAVNDGRTIPMPDGSADAAYTMLLFQHLPAEAVRSYIAEVGRVLRPGGRFLFQFIDGAECEPFSHHHSLADVFDWVEAAGMEPESVYTRWIDPNWTWMRAQRV